MNPMSCVVRRACAAAAALTLAACAALNTAGNGDGGDGGDAAAYVYGRFEVVGAEQVGSIASSFACEDGSSFSVAFRPGAAAVQAVKVAPGVCSLRGWIFTDASGAKTRRTYTGTLPKKLRFEPGTMLYVGDFEGRMKIETLGTIAQKRWRVTDAKNAFDATTWSAQASLPSATSLKAVDATATAVAAVPQAVR